MKSLAMGCVTLAIPLILFAQSAGTLPAKVRGADEVIAILSRVQPDPNLVRSARQILDAPIVESLKGRGASERHLRQAEAAEALGLMARMLHHRRKALELMRGEPEEPRFQGDLAAAEVLSGNLRNAVSLREDMVRSGRADTPIQLFLLGRYKALAGDIAGAKETLARANSMLGVEGQGRNRIAQRQPAPIRLALRDYSHATLLVAEGKSVEAEGALRQAISKMDDELRLTDPTLMYVPAWVVQATRDLNQAALVDSLLAQGKLNEAELESRAMLQQVLAKSGLSSPLSALSILRLSKVWMHQARWGDAGKLSQFAARIFQTIEVPSGSAFAVEPLQQGLMIAVGREDWPEAARQWDALSGALTVADDFTRKLHRGDPEAGIALSKAGRGAQALALADLRLGDSRREMGPSHPRSAEWQAVRAMALVAVGRPQEAVREFRVAMRLLLSTEARNIDGDGSPLLLVKRRLLMESYVALLASLWKADRGQGLGFDLLAEAFSVADATRSGAVQKALAASAARAAAREPGLGDLIRRGQDGQQEVQALYQQLLRLIDLPADQQLPKVMTDMRARIQEVERERRQIALEVAKRFPDFARLANPPPATLEEAKLALRPGEALVSVLSTRDGSFVWAMDSSGKLAFESTALGEPAIRELVVMLRASLDPGEAAEQGMRGFDFGAAHRLYTGILAPIESVWGQSSSLIVSTSGALAQIPLAILQTQAYVPTPIAGAAAFAEYAEAPWLARRLALAHLPSINAFVGLRGRAKANRERVPFVGFGDPVFGAAQDRAVLPSTIPNRGIALRGLIATREGMDLPALRTGINLADYARLPALPDTRDEILAIANALGANSARDVYLGRDASRERVRSLDLTQQRVIAFATHGLVPGDLPGLDQPALAMAVQDNSSESPLLTLDDVVGLRLDADWVILSACNTAAGDGQGAEALSGFGRGFFYAGTRSLLVTHWPVETVSARKLVSAIFVRYGGTPTPSRAQALRGAILELMGEQETGVSYAHPLFWAPYALVGDAG